MKILFLFITMLVVTPVFALVSSGSSVESVKKMRQSEEAKSATNSVMVTEAVKEELTQRNLSITAELSKPAPSIEAQLALRDGQRLDKAKADAKGDWMIYLAIGFILLLILYKIRCSRTA